MSPIDKFAAALANFKGIPYGNPEARFQAAKEVVATAAALKPDEEVKLIQENAETLKSAQAIVCTI